MQATRRRVMAWSALALGGAALAGGCGRAEAGGLLPVNADDRTRGSADAPVTIIEYASPTCGHCANFHLGAYPDLVANYVETGQVRFVLREAVLQTADYHIWLIARCLPEEDYFAFVDLVFGRQRQLIDSLRGGNEAFRDLLSRMARSAGMDADAYDACLANETEINRLQTINQSFIDTFERLATPAFVVEGVYHEELAREADPTNQLTIADFDAVLEPLLAGG